MKARVLIVDDNPHIRATVRAVVEHLAEAVFECGDGAEAVDAYRILAPDVVLMDIAMHGVDGIEATRRIRSTHPDARIVIVSDHGGAEFRQAARDAGATGFVLKDELLSLSELLADH